MESKSLGSSYDQYTKHDDRTVYTGGSDALVRIWEANSGTDQEPDTALDAAEAITALAVEVIHQISCDDLA